MKRLIALVFIMCLFAGAAGSAFAETVLTPYPPAKIKLTFHQERLLMYAVQRGGDRVVLPLTHRQQYLLETSWPGWSSGMLTVFPADMLDSDGTIYVIPQ